MGSDPFALISQARRRASRYGGHPSRAFMSEGWWTRTSPVGTDSSVGCGSSAISERQRNVRGTSRGLPLLPSPNHRTGSRVARNLSRRIEVSGRFCNALLSRRISFGADVECVRGQAWRTVRSCARKHNVLEGHRHMETTQTKIPHSPVLRAARAIAFELACEHAPSAIPSSEIWCFHKKVLFDLSEFRRH
jgi:hypothetical protein